MTTEQPPNDDPLLTPEEAATQLQLAVSTLKTWRRLRKGPASSRIGHRTVRYRQSAIDSWVREREDG